MICGYETATLIAIDRIVIKPHPQRIARPGIVLNGNYIIPGTDIITFAGYIDIIELI
jgi:hypothetical protein